MESGPFHFLFGLPILFFLPLSSASSTPCPFNVQCNCSRGSNEWQYSSVTCGPNIDGIPVFEVPARSLSVYSINMLGDVSTIQADSFVSFKSIYIMNLVHTAGPSSPLNWDNSAFAELQIQLRFSVTDLHGLLPIPEAVKKLGRNGLRQLSITNGGEGVLEENAFVEFTNLSVVHIEDTKISTIHESAFAGLEDTMYWLEIKSAGLATFPRDSLTRLNSLEYTLDLSDNGMSGFQRDDFSTFTKLKALWLSGNDLQQAIQSGVIGNLPSSLKSLYLERGNLCADVLAEVLRENAQVEFLMFSENNVEELRRGDFPDGTQLGVFDLSKNPIRNIESESLQALDQLRSIKMENVLLTSIDLSVFEGMNKLAHIDFDDSPMLRWVHVTEPEKVPTSVAFIEMGNTGIEYIDPNMDKVLDKPFAAMWFLNNTKLHCDENIHWMAKRAMCSTRDTEPLLGIRGSECANLGGKSLEVYLKELFPDPCHNDQPWEVQAQAPTPQEEGQVGSSAPSEVQEEGQTQGGEESGTGTQGGARSEPPIVEITKQSEEVTVEEIQML